MNRKLQSLLRSSKKEIRQTLIINVAAKAMEAIISQVMVSHLVKNNLISDKQHGFLKQKNTETQLLEHINLWTSWLDAGIESDIIYIDCQKAFDSVCHSKLLVKMRSYGFSDKLCDWFQNFLSD